MSQTKTVAQHSNFDIQVRDDNGAQASGKFLLLMLENSEEALKDLHLSNVPVPYHCMVLYLFVNLYLNTCDHVLVRLRVPGPSSNCLFYLSFLLLRHDDCLFKFKRMRGAFIVEPITFFYDHGI